MSKEKDFVNYVINRVNQDFNIELPDFGAFAGQALAQMYFDYYGYDIKTRINDIDLFIEDKYLSSRKLNSKNIEFLKPHVEPDFSKNCFNIDKYKKIPTTTPRRHDGSFDSIDLEQPMEMLSNLDLGITIKNSCVSKENEKLNISIYQIRKNDDVQKFNFAEALIIGFDFNSVQIGICLETKKLYKTRDFENFLKTRYVSINLNSFRSSTIIRYFDKYGYYENCIFNPEQELKALYFFEFFKKYKNKEFHKKGFASNRLEKLNPKSLNAVKKYITLEDSGFFSKSTAKGMSIEDIIKHSKDSNTSFHIKHTAELFHALFDISYSDFLKIKPFISKELSELTAIECEIRSVFLNVGYLIAEPSKAIDQKTLNVFIEKIGHHLGILNIVDFTKEELFYLFQDIFNIISYNHMGKINDYKIKTKQIKESAELLHKIKDFKHQLINMNIIKDNQNTKSKILVYSLSRFIKTNKFKIKNKKYLTDFKKSISLFPKIMETINIGFFGYIKDYKNELISVLSSPKKMNKIHSYFYNEKTKRQQDRSKYYFYTISRALNKYNDQSILNIKKSALSTLLRHDTLFIKMVDYYDILKNEHDFKNLKNYLERAAEKINYYERGENIFMIGLFENSSIPLNLFFSDLKDINDILEKSSFYTSTDFLVSEDTFTPNSEYDIRQLSKRIDLLREGIEMKHCIGGNPLTDGNIHFSLINKSLKERTTFSLRYHKGIENYQLVESRNKYNREPSIKNREIILDFEKRIQKDNTLISKTKILLDGSNDSGMVELLYNHL